MAEHPDDDPLADMTDADWEEVDGEVDADLAELFKDTVEAGKAPEREAEARLQEEIRAAQEKQRDALERKAIFEALAVPTNVGLLEMKQAGGLAKTIEDLATFAGTPLDPATARLVSQVKQINTLHGTLAAQFTNPTSYAAAENTFTSKPAFSVILTNFFTQARTVGATLCDAAVQAAQTQEQTAFAQTEEGQRLSGTHKLSMRLRVSPDTTETAEARLRASLTEGFTNTHEALTIREDRKSLYSRLARCYEIKQHNEEGISPEELKRRLKIKAAEHPNGNTNPPLGTSYEHFLEELEVADAAVEMQEFEQKTAIPAIVESMMERVTAYAKREYPGQERDFLERATTSLGELLQGYPVPSTRVGTETTYTFKEFQGSYPIETRRFIMAEFLRARALTAALLSPRLLHVDGHNSQPKRSPHHSTNGGIHAVDHYLCFASRSTRGDPRIDTNTKYYTNPQNARNVTNILDNQNDPYGSKSSLLRAHDSGFLPELQALQDTLKAKLQTMPKAIQDSCFEYDWKASIASALPHSTPEGAPYYDQHTRGEQEKAYLLMGQRLKDFAAAKGESEVVIHTRDEAVKQVERMRAEMVAMAKRLAEAEAKAAATPTEVVKPAPDTEEKLAAASALAVAARQEVISTNIRYQALDVQAADSIEALHRAGIEADASSIADGILTLKKKLEQAELAATRTANHPTTATAAPQKVNSQAIENRTLGLEMIEEAIAILASNNGPLDWKKRSQALADLQTGLSWIRLS